MIPEIVIFTTRYCPYCIRAKHFLEGRKLAYDEIAVDGNPGLRHAMEEMAGRHTVPQIWINGRHVGGCDDLLALGFSGDLDAVLNDFSRLEHHKRIKNITG